jgi:hypothetical protein
MLVAAARRDVLSKKMRSQLSLTLVVDRHLSRL